MIGMPKITVRIERVCNLFLSLGRMQAIQSCPRAPGSHALVNCGIWMAISYSTTQRVPCCGLLR